MTPNKRPTLVMLAGPNGAGKSTLFETRVQPGFAAPFINADEIHRNELQQDDLDAAYKAARLAAERRDKLLKAGKSFATESVFSHPSKLELIQQAKALGYRIMLFHVGVAHPDLSVARVTERVREGGHAVPEEKIRGRYDRNGPLIRQAVLLSDVGHVFDNSALNEPPKRVLSFKNGQVSFVLSHVPRWVHDIYAKDLTH
ncbi:zeta toxin family protein [uncultured Roseobacter sp.]|uniref:zeta toxin family protein n=2 Tax=uncultured Roseobacter sp. TaxID=114847 RepID=UPI00260D7452|nr:zeta toxin family protein [uncultured Roseobacter sp.]